ncbi:MAG: response regulator [Desulfovibrionaceae bacterium]|nr:response regulator [Desulfovibrionaceae bacterium]
MEKTRVLVVDDERDFVELFINRFSKRDLDVAGVTSGAEALDYLDQHEVDVVVLDVKMPGMDGLETLQEIKKRHSFVEVIMLTGHGSVQSGLDGMSYGAYDYILKPFKIDDLLKRIHKASERKLLKAKGGA